MSLLKIPLNRLMHWCVTCTRGMRGVVVSQCKPDFIKILNTFLSLLCNQRLNLNQKSRFLVLDNIACITPFCTYKSIFITPQCSTFIVILSNSDIFLNTLLRWSVIFIALIACIMILHNG